MKTLDIISSSLRLIGVLASGETPKNSEAQDAMLVLNSMVDSWNNQRLMLFAEVREVYPLIVGQQDYTIETGGDIDRARPARITNFGIISLNNPAQPLELPMDILTKDQWAAKPVKNLQSALPREVWNDDGFPAMTIYVWPIPNVSVNIAIYPWVQISQFADLSATDYTFPPGYSRCLRYNLAVELCPEFGAPLRPEVASIAASSKAEIKSLNEPMLQMSCDPALVKPGKPIFNWLTGEALKRG